MIKIRGREYLCTREAAELIGMSVEQLRSYLQTGRVFKTAQKPYGTRWFITKAECQRFKAGKIKVTGAYTTQ